MYTSLGARTSMVGRPYVIRDGQWLMVEANISNDAVDIAEALHWIIGSFA